MLIKEEKRKGSSKFFKSLSSQTTNPNNKQNKPNQQFLQKLSPKNIKRIGTKPIVKAFQAVIQIIPEQPFCQQTSENKEKDRSLSQKSGFQSIQDSGYKKLKRVGKKSGVASYQETITENGSKKATQVIENQPDIQHTIIIKQPQQIQQTQLKYTPIRESIAQSTKWRKQSIQVDDTIDILNSIQPSSSSLFQQVISEEGQLSKKRFSINVNKVQLVDKSDVCIENASFIKTQSDLIRGSNSFSLPNEIESCVGEEKISFIQTCSNDDDSKIEELIEEIQNNYEKNRGSEQSKRSSGNYLQVPNNTSRNSLNRFSSLNKPIGQDRILGSSLGSSLDSKTQKAKSQDQNQLHKSSILSDMSQEQKIIQSLQQKSRKKKLEQFTNLTLKNYQLSNDNIRKSQGFQSDHNKVQRTLSKIEEVIQNQNITLGASNVIISKQNFKANFSTPLNASKKSIPQDNTDNDLKKSGKSQTIRIKKMTHSTYSKESRQPSAQAASKKSIKLNEIQVKNNQNTGSLHNPMNHRTPLKNNKNEQTPTNNPKIRQLKQNQAKNKDQKVIRKNSRKFEVNKLVTEARKVTKQKQIL